MRNSKSLKRIPIIMLTFFALSVLPLWADDSSQADWPLGTFNYDFARLGADESSQISALESIGYSGLVLNIGSNRNLGILKGYQEAIEDAPFGVYAGFLVVDLTGNLAAQNAHIDNAIPILKKSDAKLWVIVLAKDGKKVEREQIVAFLRSAAERTKAAGVELVIYPHGPGGNSRNEILIQTAEEAIPYVEETGSDNLFISLHLCHEIRGGNGDRLVEVAAKVKPWLRLPSISGADIDAVNERDGWARGIQPLTQGDYDSSKLLKALKSVDYKGPVVLHTFGLQTAAADHHHTSYKKYQEMVAALEPKSPTLKRSHPRFNQPQVPNQSEASRITPESWRKPRQEIRSASLEEKIDYLLDRAEIEDIITTYSYTVDTRDYALHGELFKDAFPLRGRDGYRDEKNQKRLDRMKTFFKRFTSTQHLAFPLVIQIEGDTAYATASLHARHWDENGDPLDNTLLFGQYEFWFERTSEGWKVSKLAQVNRTQINTSEAKFKEED